MPDRSRTHMEASRVQRSRQERQRCLPLKRGADPQLGFFPKRPCPLGRCSHTAAWPPPRKCPHHMRAAVTMVTLRTQAHRDTARPACPCEGKGIPVPPRHSNSLASKPKRKLPRSDSISTAVATAGKSWDHPGKPPSSTTDA